jgi:uncharacterized 2Fe-2S/4Fe-4S cluster protein (DUF4445 family)
MRTQEIKITFQPSGRSVFVLPGTVLLEAAEQAGFILETPCGGAGKCGKCLIRIVSGKCQSSEHEKEVVGQERFEQGYRLACHCKADGPLTIEVPDSSLFQSGLQILSHDTGEDVEVEAGGIPGQCFGIAFDIGTTTLVGTLVDMATGTDLAVSSAVNPQTSYGDDVVSRIKKCRDDADGLRLLNGSIRKAVNSIISKLLKHSGVDKNAVYQIVCAGNTTMQEILCNIDPSSLGEIPFTPAVLDPVRMKAAEMKLGGVNPDADVFVFPNIGGFVGGDTVAGIVATRLDRRAEPALLVDVGTNGEIVLAHGGRLMATSVAAGPAFEGARIVAGMRAANGAVEKVVTEDGDIKVNVIGNSKASGICGSGLLDAAAEMLRLGVLDSTGRIVDPDELTANVPDAIRKRIVRDNGQFSFVLVDGAKTASGKPLALCQKDIRELQLANGAIRAGINILLKMERLKPADLGCILLAGAFGNFIRRSNAVRIGMLPQVPSERIRFVGNTSSFGAKRALLSAAEKEYAQEIRRKTRHVDLSLSPDFQSEFSEAMLFPESANLSAELSKD